VAKRSQPSYSDYRLFFVAPRRFERLTIGVVALANDPQIKRTLFGCGGRVAVYRCQQCAAKLKSPLDEVGTTDNCPACGATFTVPGSAERDHLRNAKIAKQEAKRALAEAKRKAKTIPATIEAVPSNQTHTSPPPFFYSPTRRRFIAATTAVSVFAICAAVGSAFFLGRKTAVPLAADKVAREITPGPIAPALSPGETKHPPAVNTTAPPTIGTATPIVVAPQSSSELEFFKEAATLRRVIAEAEKSVALLEIKGHTSDKDGRGSGFLVGSRILVTNRHVIEGAKSVQVTFSDGRKASGLGWLAVDHEMGLALIACDSGKLRPLTLAKGRPSKLDTVFAIGSPLELSGAVSSGIVSAIRTEKELGKDVVLIQTTAAISPGNSGGPLLNASGEAIGVTFANLEGGQNLNCAVAAQHVAELFVTAKIVPQPWHKLPLPPQKPLAGKTEADPAAEWRAKQQQMMADAEKKRLEAGKTEGELNRIVARAGQLTQALSVIEAEGTALTVQRDQIYQAMQATAARGNAATSAAGPAVAWSVSLQGYVVNHEAIMMKAEANNAWNTAATLQQQYNGICQQINFKARQRDELVNELSVLRKKYEELRVK
jgi:S1-C subfamily serine protease